MLTWYSCASKKFNAPSLFIHLSVLSVRVGVGGRDERWFECVPYHSLAWGTVVTDKFVDYSGTDLLDFMYYNVFS